MIRGQRSMFVVGAAALVAASCSSGPSAIDGKAVADVIDDTLDDADFDEDDVVDLALDGDPDETAFSDPVGETIDCSFVADDVVAGAGLFMLEAPRDVDEYTEEFATGGEGGARVDIDPTTAVASSDTCASSTTMTTRPATARSSGWTTSC